jgi:phosphoserine phosphatase
LPIDVCVVPVEGRRKALLIADMDSTIIQQECIDEMADILGLKPRIAAITERAMRGEIPFEAALTERLALLAGLAEGDLQRVFDERITLMPGAPTLVATMRAGGAFTALVSGGFSFFTSRVAAAVGFDVNRANTLEVVDGRLTGRVVGPILGREAKLTALEHYRGEHGLAAAATMAVGDGANDLAMIKAAGLGVAYRAKPLVAEQAHAGIAHGDLRALLFLQGYARSEFVDRG